MAKTRWFVKSPFGDYEVGDEITDPALAAEYAAHVLRLADDPESVPTKAEVRAEGVPPATEARQAVGLPSGPVEDGDGKPKRTSHQLKG